MEEALVTASLVPIEIMEKCCKAIEVIEEFAEKGSVIAISDAGVAASCCKAALIGASFNVYINTKCMQNTEYAQKLNKKSDEMIEKYSKLADDIIDSVMNRIR